MNATLDQDFENLYETAMHFRGNDWQAQDGRFIKNTIDYSYEMIYWFDRFADVLLAKQILTALDEEYTVLFDTICEQWVITSNHVSEAWRS